MKRIKVLFLSVLLICSLIIISGGSSIIAQDNVSLKIGIMPAVDSAPILLAQKRGYFKDEGIDIEIDVYTNAVNRQSALQTGELDGAMTDYIALVNNINNGFPVKLTLGTDGVFPFLVKKDFEEKEEIDIGMMEVSVSNFLSEQFLSDKYKMNKIFIAAIPARLEMIKSGKLDMAIIPEPMASMGELAGLEKRVYENEYDYMPEGMIFTEKALAEKEKAILGFHKAYNRAIKDIIEDEELARDILIEKLKLKPEVKDLITLPNYRLGTVPSESYINRVIEFVEEKQNESIDLSYQDIVEEKFVTND
ncbi:MAG: ABC transporter substrate-binding protein [Halanaerobiales bacterium]|nr:ABC transporter substrate-binding protein [Halanaerobiales bacterium]